MSGYNNTKRFQYQTQIDINYDIPVVKGLALGVTAAYDGQINDDRRLYKNFILYDYITDIPKTTSVAPTTFNNSISNYIRKEIQTKLSYRRSFNQHNISSTLFTR